MADVNNQKSARESSAVNGMGGTDNTDKERVSNKVKKLPFPESWTVKQGSTNDPMDMRAPEDSDNTDFISENFSSENKNPNNESYAKKSQPRGSGPGLGVIGKLANSSKWGQTGK